MEEELSGMAESDGKIKVKVAKDSNGQMNGGNTRTYIAEDATYIQDATILRMFNAQRSGVINNETREWTDIVVDKIVEIYPK